MNKNVMLYKGFKPKALTFSYDDGEIQDIRLTELFNKYGLKGTFNLNSGFMPEKVGTPSSKVALEQIPEVYKGHEVAVHTVHHPFLEKLHTTEIISEIMDDRQTLEKYTGYVVRGMAYPFGTYNDNVVKLIDEQTGVLYSRTVRATCNFDVQTDLLRFHPTCHHKHPDVFEMAKKFIEMKPDTPQVLYIWGHSYEFDREDGEWERMEELCKLLSGHDDIFYGTNAEVLLAK